MMIRALSCGVALAVLLTSAAHAGTEVIAQAGGWQAFGGTTDNGVGVCGISRDVNSQYLGLKLFAGDETFTIQVGSAQWKIPKGANVPVVMIVDSNPPWRATGTGFVFNDGDPGIQYDINNSEVAKFMKEFRNGSKLRLQFEGTMLADWVLDLAGTNEVSDAFVACTLKLKKP